MEAVSQAGTLRSFTERRPRVMLEWDSALNKVVAPQSQVGISWSQTYGDSRKGSGSHLQARLLDGFDIPQELLELPDLTDILSVETWDNCLTRSEREILSMYLPEGVDPGSTVEALLSGRNFHFGNPLQTWGISVCAGNMHPDTILHRELTIKEQRKAYSRVLKSYHDTMVQNVQNMKEIWQECENPEAFLPQIQRFGAPGGRTHGRHIKNVFHPHKMAVESADLRKRDWREVGEGVYRARDISTRPKAMKQNVNKLSEEEGSKRLKIKPAEFEMERVKFKPSGGPNRLKIKPTGLKGGKIGQPGKGATINTAEVGTTRLKIKSPEGAKKLEIKPLEEGKMKGQLKPSQGETRRPTMKPTEGAVNASQMKPGDDAVKRLEMKMSDEGLKGLKMRPSSEVVGRLKIKLSRDGRKKLKIQPAEEGLKRLQTIPLDDRKDLAMRPTAKRSTEEGAKRLDNEHAEEGTKKSQIKLSEAGRKNQLTRSPEEKRDPANRLNAKRRKVKLSEEERAPRLKTKISEGGSKSLKMKPSQEGQKVLNMKPSEGTTKTLLIRASREGKGLKLKPLKEGAQRPKISLVEEKDLLSRQRRSKVKPGTKKLKIKRIEEGQEERDVGHSDFEGEWFKKYVQVTMGPLSGHRLSKAIQSVQVTAEMFKDVKRRSEAGEEVHLETLVPIKAFKKATAPSSNEEDIIASFWQTVLIKDLPAVHVRFMQRREQLRKLATSLASSCKNLWEIELNVICDEPSNSPEQSLQHPSLSPIPAALALVKRP